MAWIESHQELRYHPKVEHLAILLKVTKVQAIGHLHCLWWWAVDYAKDGYVNRYPDPVVARGAEWDGDAAAFMQALREARWLDPDGKLHDWEEYAGRLIERQQRAKERWRRWKDAQADGADTHDQRVANALQAHSNAPTDGKQTDSNAVNLPTNLPTVTNLPDRDHDPAGPCAVSGSQDVPGSPDREPPSPPSGEVPPLPGGSTSGSPEKPKQSRKTTAVRLESLMPAVREFHEHWCRVWSDEYPRGPMLTPGRIDKIKKRLERFSVEQLKEACDNLHASPWAHGQNERQWVADIDYLIRNDENVDKWLRHPPARAGPNGYRGGLQRRYPVDVLLEEAMRDEPREPRFVGSAKIEDTGPATEGLPEPDDARGVRQALRGDAG